MAGVENFPGNSESGCALSYLFCFGRMETALTEKRVKPTEKVGYDQKTKCQIWHK